MTPDEHAAEAERILAGFRKDVGPDHHNLEAARIHALLATRQPEPEPILLRMGSPSMEESAARVDAWRSVMRSVARVTAGGDQPAGAPTIRDYDKAVERAARALWDTINADVPAATYNTVRSWAKVVIDTAGAPDPTTEPS